MDLENRFVSQEDLLVTKLPRVLCDLVRGYSVECFKEGCSALLQLVHQARESRGQYAGKTHWREHTKKPQPTLYIELVTSQCHAVKPVFFVVLESHGQFTRGDVHMTFRAGQGSFLKGVPSNYKTHLQGHKWSDLGTRVGNVETAILPSGPGLSAPGLDWTLSLWDIPYNARWRASNLRDWCKESLTENKIGIMWKQILAANTPWKKVLWGTWGTDD